jgi:hypothetical protein
MTENFSKSEEWNQIKESIYVVPIVELPNSKEFEPYEYLKDLEKTMRCKYQAKNPLKHYRQKSQILKWQGS